MSNIRPSPTDSASKYAVGKKMKGNDGNLWIVSETKTGTKRLLWTKYSGLNTRTVSTKSKSRDVSRKNIKKETLKEKTTKSYVPRSKLSNKAKIYEIYDNGARPFKVIATKNNISVFKKKISKGKHYERDEYDKISERSRVASLPYDILVKKFTKFIGYWPGIDSTSSYNMRDEGNTILIQVNKKEYISIGAGIYSFKTDDEIYDYVSPIGGSVPYPVAFSQDKVYFMLDFKFINRTELETPVTVPTAEKLYSEFYGHIGHGKHKKYKVKNLKVLVKRFV